MKYNLLKSLRLLEDFIPYNYTDYKKLLIKNVVCTFEYNDNRGTIGTIVGIDYELVNITGFDNWFTYYELFLYFTFLDGSKIGRYKKINK